MGVFSAPPTVVDAKKTAKMWNYKVFFIAIILSAISVNNILAYVEV